MKKIAIAALAIAAAAAMSQVAKADTFDFTYTSFDGTVVYATGTLSGAPGQSATDPIALTTGSITILAASGYDFTGTADLVLPAINFGADDSFYPSLSNQFVDGSGLEFASNTDDLNLYLLGAFSPSEQDYQLFDSNNTTLDGTLTVSAVTPEPSSMFLLGTGLIAMILAVCRKTESFGAVVNII